MEQVAITAQRREETGKGPAYRLREQGLVPGVAYGLGREHMVISVSRKELASALGTERGANVLIDLQIEGIKVDKDTAAIVKEVQRHPISREPLSVDLQWISLTEKITVQVPVEVEGEAPGVEEGGVVDLIMHQVQVACLPAAIPDHIMVDITGMEINDTKHADQLQLPPDVEILADLAETVVTISPPIKEEDLETRVAEELLAGLEEIPIGEEELELAPEEAEEVPGEEAPAEEESE